MLSLHPFAGARIALLVTNMLGDVKGEHYSDSASEAMAKAHADVQWPDTIVTVFDTSNTGERTKPTAQITYNQVSGTHTWLPLS